MLGEENIVPRERVARGSVIESDAIVIGTGAGGAVAARELAAAGLRVSVLEEGPYLTGRDYGARSPIDSVKLLYRKAGFTTTVGNATVILPTGRCVGGTTVINSGTALRPRPSSVDRWRHEFGLTALTDGLESYAGRVEAFLGVKPVPVLNRANDLFRIGAERMGWRGSVLTRNEKNCRGAGRCFLGCPNDAKQAMNVSYIPDALRRGAVLYTRARARRVILEGGRAAGVATSRATFRAPIVVVAAGAVFTPRLLRRPGRHLKIHPATRVVGLFDEEVRGWQGVPQAYHLEEFMEEGISIETITLPPALMGAALTDVDALRDYSRMAILGCRTIESDTEGRVFPNPLGSWPILWYWLKDSDADKIRRAALVAAQIMFAAGARKAYTGLHGFEEMGPRDLERLRRARIAPADMELSAYHAQGTARMADSPEKGVADPDGQVWGVPGLYVADASAMPASPINNPQISIMIFATHVARKILERAGRCLTEEADVARHHSH